MPPLPTPIRQAVRQLARREFLNSAGLGLGAIALGSLLTRDGSLRGAGQGTAESSETQPAASQAPARPRPHHRPRAKAVIQLFMCGGPSQLELFDPKPRLNQLHGQVVPPSFTAGKRFAFIKPDATLLGCERTFRRHGESGIEVSSCLPETSGIVDDIALIRTMHTDNFNHGPAKLLTQTGYQTFGYPSAGAWALYGLGSECDNLPGYVVLQSGNRGPRGGAYLWSSGFLSSNYAGVPLRSQGEPILNLASPRGLGGDRQRRVVESVAQLNALHQEAIGDEEIAARTASYEMGFRMQASAPELIDVSDETAATLAAYGVEPGKPSFAYNCLLARRLVERGVRYITLFHTDWDMHGGGENLAEDLDQICRETDRPTAALVRDLKQTGLLDQTLVIWGGEFGRTPMGESRQNKIGRDHHIEAYSTWLAGAGVKPGVIHGETDELGFGPTESSDRVHVHDLQATMLHLLGLDHLRLNHRHQGRDFRLTDVGGNVLHSLLG